MSARTKLAVAVTAALGASAATTMNTAYGDSAFFHNLAGSPTVASIISVMNTSQDVFDAGGNPINDTAGNLHYRFFYKHVTGVAADDNALACNEFNEFLPTSYNDIQTIDLTGYFGEDVGGLPTGVMFNDPSVNNDWQTGQDYALGRNVVPFRGYLIVENAASSDGNYSVAGESFVFEYGVGATWGYQAYMNDGFEDPDYLRFGSNNPSAVAIMPTTEVSTAYLVTAVDEDQTPLIEFDEEVTLAYVDIFDGASGPQGIWDRDERPISGALDQTVVCVGRVDAQDLLPLASQARLAGGGWATLWNGRFEDDDTITPEAGVVVKLEYNTGGTLDGQPVSGVFNNALLLRPNEFDNTQE